MNLRYYHPAHPPKSFQQTPEQKTRKLDLQIRIWSLLVKSNSTLWDCFRPANPPRRRRLPKPRLVKRLDRAQLLWQ